MMWQSHSSCHVWKYVAGWIEHWTLDRNVDSHHWSCAEVSGKIFMHAAYVHSAVMGTWWREENLFFTEKWWAQATCHHSDNFL